MIIFGNKRIRTNSAILTERVGATSGATVTVTSNNNWFMNWIFDGGYRNLTIHTSNGKTITGQFVISSVRNNRAKLLTTGPYEIN